MIYLDHAATTPVQPAALEAAWPWLTSGYGNPNSDIDVTVLARKPWDQASGPLRPERPVDDELASGGSIKARNRGIAATADYRSQMELLRQTPLDLRQRRLVMAAAPRPPLSG
mgnify:CR=1 FL=1